MRTYLAATAAVLALVAVPACKSRPAESAGAVPAQPAHASAPVDSAQAPAGTAAPESAAPPAPQSGNTLTGSIAETMNSGGYTYARLTGGKEDVWIAAPQFDARVGETISVSLDMPMQQFQSKTLNRTFPLLYFVQDVGRDGQPSSGRSAGSGPALMNGHGASAAGGAAGAGASPQPVAKLAPPPGGMSIADVFARKASLSGKPVTVRGTVVKFNGGIMDRNWLHIQDGSGSGDAHNNDLTVTTTGDAKVGDVVTVSGVLGTGRDFGAGYAYDAIVEKATVKAE